MKTNKILVMALLLGFAGAGFTSCAIKDNEKKAEMVEDPIQATTEYYINGKVVDANGNNLSGVTVSAGESVVVKTAADGTFSLTVNATGSYNVAASMDGYLKASGTVTVPQNATNRSSYNTSFIMEKKAAGISVAQDNTADVVISTETNTNVGNLDNVDNGLAVAIPGNTTNLAGSEISVTEYIPEVSAAAVENQEAPVVNIYVETSKDIDANGITLAIANPAQSGETTFESFNVYKSTVSRSDDGFTKIGEAFLDNGNKFSIVLDNGKLAGDYSFRVKYNSTATTGKETVSGEKDNSGSMNAIRDYKISYNEKMGWEYTDQNAFSGLDEEIVKMMKNAIKACQGAEGVTTTSKSLTTNISGNHILYYTVDNNYTETTYKFVMTGGKNVTVKTKAYTGTKLNYQIVSADQHSGGTANGN